MLIMYYKMNIITQAKGLEYTDTNVLLINDFEQYSKINAEMIKYQTTDDIVGFSWSGRREEVDQDTTFALYNTLKIVNKNDPEPTMFPSSPFSDQYI